MAQMVQKSAVSFRRRPESILRWPDPPWMLKYLRMDPGLRRDDIALEERWDRAHKKKRAGFPALSKISVRSLTLGELERTTGLCLAVLLAFDDAAVAGQEATLLEHWAQGRLEEVQRLGDAVTDST